MSKSEYLDNVQTIKEAILRGDLYQANLTRKFFCKFESKPNAFQLFNRLCQASPAPYSALIKHNNLHIISSSPERFVSMKANGQAETRPIKGSLGIEHDASILQNSRKDCAENLMIVDLMRNDFSRTCIPCTVTTPELFKITSYATLHHMHSTVQGQKRQELSSLEVLRQCFPPGSMTGAPKIEAIELCSQLEQTERGIYSGCIGWFGGDGSFDTSVVIRTMMLENTQLEFQVGGAIVADSDPEKEWEETMVKARGMVEALRLDKSEIQKL